MDNLNNRVIRGYQLRECVSTGGFGAVYRAYQPAVGREVAIKVILPHYANHPDFIRRFEVEAQLIARLEHPHIVPLYDYWREPDGAYLVMRWLPGNLHSAIQRGPWSVEAAARLLEQIAEALTVAHRDGVIHGDIKPVNILLDEDENAYLADFGIAKDLGVGNIAEEEAAGYLSYITPEQIKGELVTPRTDIYSLGLVLYELLVGEKPYPEATTRDELTTKHLNVPLPPLHTQRPNLSVALNEVLQTAMTKDPTHRYANALRFAAAFRAAVPNPQRTPTQPLAIPLTERELDILRLMVAGLSNREIAQERHLTEGTVRWYVQQIYRKLDVHSRRQAIERTLQINLIAAESPSASVIVDSSSRPEPTTAVRPDTSVAAPELVNPYKGLRAFGEADTVDFFGRAALTEQLLARLAESGDGARFLAVVGPSGSGKSSVVRAGLIPALRQGGLLNSERWFITEMLPGAHPLDELEVALLRVAAGPLPSLLSQLSEDRRGLVRAAKRVLPSDQDVELVLVIDQFEELFTLLADETTRTHLIDNILSAVTDPRSRVRVVLTLRADFYDRPLIYPRLAELMRSHTEVVVPLTFEELERAIAGPAERVGLTLEPGLVATIAHDVEAQPGALPLLQYALTELFERREGQALKRAAYHDSGGISGALARRADELYNELDSAGQAVARQLFLRLITLGEGAEDTRRRVLLSEFGSGLSHQSAFDEVLDIFGRYRLLTFDRDPLTRGPTVEIAHEALIRAWGRLREWLAESREDLRIQRQLTMAAREWANARHDPSFLAAGARLARFDALATESDLALNEQEREYVDASVAERQQRETERRAQRRRLLALQRSIVGVLVVSLLVAIGLSAFALNRWREALSQARVAFSRQLAAQALAEVQKPIGNDEFAALLAIRSLKDQYDPVADGALVEAASKLPLRAFTGHSDEVRSVAFSPDGKYVLTGSADTTVKLWEAATGQEVRTLNGHTGEISGVTFSPDGKYILTASADTTAKLWEVTTGQEMRNLRGHTDEVVSAAFSPDGKYIFTTGADGAAKLWEVATGQEVRAFGRGDAGLGAAFSPDGKYMLAGGGRYTAKLWEVATGQEVHTLRGHSNWVYGVAFSPDGKYVLTGSLDNTAILWDVVTGQEVYTIRGHSSSVRSVAFSPDGNYVLTGSGDRTARLWDVATGLEVRTWRGHMHRVLSVAFSPDGKYVLTGSADGTAKLWDFASGEGRTLRGHSDEIRGVAVSPDGRYMLTGSVDNTAKLWDVGTGQEVRTFSGHSELVWSVTFSPDGKYVLTGSNDSTAKLWEVATGQEVRTFSGHTNSVYDAAFSPDGIYVLTGSDDHTAKLWDTATGAEVRTFSGHNAVVLSVAFSPDGKYVLTGSADTTAKLWDVVTGQEVRTFSGHIDSIYDAVFSPDGNYVLTGSADTTGKLWNATTGQEVRTFSGHTNTIYNVAFSPDGKYILTASADRTARLWDLATGGEVRTLSGHASAIWSAAFSPDGKYVLTGSLDHTARLWEADYHGFVAAVCAQLLRDFTDQEREQAHIADQEPSCPQFGK